LIKKTKISTPKPEEKKMVSRRKKFSVLVGETYFLFLSNFGFELIWNRKKKKKVGLFSCLLAQNRKKTRNFESAQSFFLEIYVLSVSEIQYTVEKTKCFVSDFSKSTQNLKTKKMFFSKSARNRNV
jgi:hypothetical protein